MIDLIWLDKAIKCVAEGIADKMTTVYRVNNIIRIDYKCA